MRWNGNLLPKRKSRFVWRNWFALMPVKTISGVWVWLEWVERNRFMNPDVPAEAPNSFFGWSYRTLP